MTRYRLFFAAFVAIWTFSIDGFCQFTSNSYQGKSDAPDSGLKTSKVKKSQYEQLNFEDRSLWHVGIQLGPRFTFTKFSNLDASLFGEVPMQTSFVWGLYVKKDFAKHFSFRPELLFLQRNARVNFNSLVLPANSSGHYDLNASYFDIRVPLIYEFNRRWLFCPYVYIAPVFGIVTGGDTSMSISVSGETQSKSVSLSKSNINPVYFAAMAAFGVNLNIKNLANVGVEIGYEYGITDTYSRNEKEGKSVVSNNLIFPVYDIQGNRKFSGLELKFSVSVPFSTFKKRKPVSSPGPSSFSPAPAPVREAPVEKTKIPYFVSLDQANDAINEGRDISGMIICDAKSITFENNSSTLSLDSYSYLDLIVALMNNTQYNVEIQGHTDNVGEEKFNMRLSERRAKTVYLYLISKGVDSKRISYSFYGESRPVADNETPEGRAQNRRVEFIIK